MDTRRPAWRSTPHLLAVACRRWMSDGASREGAALAFYATLSLAPFLLVMATVAAFFLGTEAAQGYLLREGGALVGDDASALLERMLKSGASSQANGWAALIGIGTTLAGATAGFSELQTALNRIFIAPEPRRGIVALA